MLIRRKASGASRHHPYATVEDCTVAELFTNIRIAKHCHAQPDGVSPELTLMVDGAFGGVSLYVTPCQQLRDVITQLSIYGEPKFKDVYLRVIHHDPGTPACGRWYLTMQYQQILGSYNLFELPESSGMALHTLYKTGVM